MCQVLSPVGWQELQVPQGLWRLWENNNSFLPPPFSLLPPPSSHSHLPTCLLSFHLPCPWPAQAMGLQVKTSLKFWSLLVSTPPSDHSRSFAGKQAFPKPGLILECSLLLKIWLTGCLLWKWLKWSRTFVNLPPQPLAWDVEILGGMWMLSQ